MKKKRKEKKRKVKRSQEKGDTSVLDFVVKTSGVKTLLILKF